MARLITLNEMKAFEMGTLPSGKAVCISDIHLRDQEIAKSHRVANFIHNLDASTLFLMGDIFDFWMGDAHSTVPAYKAVIRAIKRRVDTGTKIFTLRGNRDFLAENYLESEAGTTAAGDAITFSAGGKKILLTHGDTVCTWDIRYAAWRRICSRKAVQDIERRMPLPVGRFIGNMMRLGSQMEVKFKPRCSIEQFEAGLKHLYRDGIDVIVSGHIHRIGDRTHEIGGKENRLIVLGGWEEGGGRLEIEDGALSLKRWKKEEQS